MQKIFKDVKEGETFRIISKNGQENLTLIKIPFMQNFYRTTGNKRNAQFKTSTSKMNHKYLYVEDDQVVEIL